MIILYVLAIIALLNLIFWWCKEGHELEIVKITGIGRLEARIGIEEQDCRDFDLTISFEPRWYLTFQLSLWTIYCSFEWSRDIDSYVDCDHEGVECFHCGCKNQCGKTDDASEVSD